MAHEQHQPRPGRAWIITPGLHPDRFAGAQHSGAGVAVVDIKDSVPLPDKHTARTACAAFFDLPDPPCTLGIRMNGLTTIDGIKDLAALTGFTTRPDIIVVPKVESPATSNSSQPCSTPTATPPTSGP